MKQYTKHKRFQIQRNKRAKMDTMEKEQSTKAIDIGNDMADPASIAGSGGMPCAITPTSCISTATMETTTI
uniref:Uncharacterized protein n=1 Tax=Rhizophora mucronata TaxID=61149 RepID=A0A2P2MXX9_RHIMU